MISDTPRRAMGAVTMADTAIERLGISRARTLRRSVGEQLAELRDERELSQREVAAAVGLDRSWLSRAEAGEANLTIEALAKLATVLGAETSLRLYPATGPRLRDHIQVRLIETLLAVLHERWRARLEVPVYRPVRGVIDLVLTESEAAHIVSGEAHSEIRRAERQLRWAAEKADALTSADGWPWTGKTSRTSRMLILRSTSATRSTVRSAPHLFAAAYPGSSEDAVSALAGPVGDFPVAAIVWIDLRGTHSRVLDGPPRGIALGR